MKHKRFALTACFSVCALLLAPQPTFAQLCRSALASDEKIEAELNDMAKFFVKVTGLPLGSEKAIGLAVYKERFQNAEKTLGRELGEEMKIRIENARLLQMTDAERKQREADRAREEQEEMLKRYTTLKKVETFEAVREIHLHDGTAALAGSQIWSLLDLRTGKRTQVTAAQTVATVSTGLEFLYSIDSNHIYRQDLKSGKKEKFSTPAVINKGDRFTRAAVTPDGAFLVVASKAHLFVFRTSNFSLHKKIESMDTTANDLVISRDSRYAAVMTSLANPTAKVFELATGRTIDVKGTYASRIDFDSVNERLLISTRADELKKVRGFDLTSGNEVNPGVLSNQVSALGDGRVFTLEGNDLAKNPQQTLRIKRLDSSTPDLTVQVPASSVPTSVAVANTKPLFAIWTRQSSKTSVSAGGEDSGLVVIVNYESGEIILERPVRRHLSRLVFSPDDRSLLGVSEGELYVLK